jgi:acyl carrier protein phosphodiesterase
MNLLAHFVLSFDHREVLLGQFIADAVKGSRYRDYPRQVANGILLHRFIDSSTDGGEVLQPLRQELRPLVGLYAPVWIDLLLDHILARDFESITGKQLPEFANESMAILEEQIALVPQRLLPALHAMRTYRWLEGYAQVEGIEKSARGLAKRVREGHRLEPAIPHLTSLLKHSETAFYLHFPRLLTECRYKFDSFARHEKTDQ